MKTRIYSIFDIVSDSTVLIGTAPTDGAFIRQNRNITRDIQVKGSLRSTL